MEEILLVNELRRLTEKVSETTNVISIWNLTKYQITQEEMNLRYLLYSPPIFNHDILLFLVFSAYHGRIDYLRRYLPEAYEHNRLENITEDVYMTLEGRGGIISNELFLPSMPTLNNSDPFNVSLMMIYMAGLLGGSIETYNFLNQNEEIQVLLRDILTDDDLNVLFNLVIRGSENLIIQDFYHLWIRPLSNYYIVLDVYQLNPEKLLPFTLETFDMIFLPEMMSLEPYFMQDDCFEDWLVYHSLESNSIANLIQQQVHYQAKSVESQYFLDQRKARVIQYYEKYGWNDHHYNFLKPLEIKISGLIGELSRNRGVGYATQRNVLDEVSMMFGIIEDQTKNLIYSEISKYNEYAMTYNLEDYQISHQGEWNHIGRNIYQS